MLTQNKNTGTWPANNSPAMCKTRHEHAANEKTHKPCVHTRHDYMKARSQWNTQSACHTAQDITWMHAADRNTNCVQHNKSHVDRRARSRANSRPRTHTMTENRARVSEPWHETENTWCRALTWKQDMAGVSGLCHKTMNNTRPKWQNPDNKSWLA